MNENTSLDNLFTEEDKREIEKIQEIRHNILKYIGIKNFIDMMRELIDNSKYFEFTSATKRKFINENTPIFTIKCKNYKPNKQKILKKDMTYIDSEINQIVKKINEDILKKTTKKILDYVEKDVKLKDLYGNLDEDTKFVLWTTIFEIKVSLQDNIIYLRYCI